MLPGQGLGVYAHWQAHSAPVVELHPLTPAMSPRGASGPSGCLSLSAGTVALHGLGGAPRLHYVDEVREWPLHVPEQAACRPPQRAP